MESGAVEREGQLEKGVRDLEEGWWSSKLTLSRMNLGSSC